MEIIDIFGLKLKILTKKDIFYEEEACKFIIPVNSDIIIKANKCLRMKNLIENNYVTIDGQIPFFIIKLFFPKSKIEKISGSDLIYDFCEYAEKYKKSLFLIGGSEKSNLLAVYKLREKYRIKINGISPPFEEYPFSKKFDSIIFEKIIDFKPDLIFVGFGTPKQEFWLDDNIKFLFDNGVRYAIGCGGTIDFVSGVKIRAPKIIQYIGLEGIWRLLIEPKLFRLKRIIDSFMIFRYMFKKS
jgi:N-acetylglucosaminyldiphosphoundecaprenol N-acetyl-beta-D-mannosaminyltransferase